MKSSNKIYTTLAIIVLIAGSYAFFNSRGQELIITNYYDDAPTLPIIVMVGDSLVEGFGASKRNSLPEQLGKKLSVPVLNLGISGSTTQDVLRRVNDVPQNAYLVIIIAGGNDVLKRVPEEETLANMQAIISRLHEQGSIVAIASVKSSFFGEGSLTQKYQAIAKETGSIYLGSILSGVYGNDSLMSDSIHPNDAGYTIIADNIHELIERFIN